jgi:CheY-like chemotaxis protein/HPt (histidine-containing phosphotransfer) domain-containing protein
VLVAEDNAVNQKLAVRMLEKLGCRVDVAANGKEAVEMLGMLPYDVVFMDCQMPEMDGYDATAEIRRREARSGRRTPVVAMTAHAMAGDRQKCLAAGMDDYLTKPVRAADVAAALARWSRADANGTGPTEAEPRAGEPAPIDPTVFANLADLDGNGSGSGSLLAELVEIFLTDTAAYIAALRRAADAKDAGGLNTAAHTLKWSSGVLGALGMADLCRQLEALGDASAPAGAAALIDRLEQEFGRVRSALEARLAPGAR